MRDLYLSDQVAAPMGAASVPQGTSIEPYSGSSRSGFKVFWMIVLIAVAGTAGWLLKGHFVHNELQAAHRETVTAKMQAQTADIKYGQGYDTGYTQGFADAEAQAQLADGGAVTETVPADDPDAYNIHQYCGAGTDLTTQTKVIVLGYSSYWLDTDQSTSALRVGEWYAFSVDEINWVVRAFDANPVAPFEDQVSVC